MTWTTEKMKEYQKEYKKANKDKIAEGQKEYYEANKDMLAEYRKEYLQTNASRRQENNWCNTFRNLLKKDNVNEKLFCNTYGYSRDEAQSHLPKCVQGDLWVGKIIKHSHFQEFGISKKRYVYALENLKEMSASQCLLTSAEITDEVVATANILEAKFPEIKGFASFLERKQVV